jgi:hypothetical protein
MQPPVSAVASATVCANTPVQLNAQDCNTLNPAGYSYAWTPATGLSCTTCPNPIATVGATTVYQLVATYTLNNPPDPSFVSTVTVTIAPNPTITVSPSTSVCPGSNAQLTALTNGTSIVWTPSVSLSCSTCTTTIATPSVTTTYTATSTNSSGCVATATTTVALFSNPTITITNSTTNVCIGGTATLTASGASTYTWQPGNISGNPIVVSPMANTTYSVTGTDANGCIGTSTITVNFFPAPSPTISITGAHSICSGTSLNLTAHGVFPPNYQWSANAGSATTQVVNVSPTTTTTYSVLGTNSFGCTQQGVATVTVNPTPTLTISPTTSVCAGQSVQLNSVTSETTLAWAPASSLNCNPCLNPVASPTTTTTYTATATNSFGCQKKATLTITVHPNPTINVTATPTVICAGQQAVIHASGAGNGGSIFISPTANSQTFTPNGNAGTFSVTPSVTTVYSIAGYNHSGCFSVTTITITVNPIPTVSITPSPTLNPICSGTTETLTASGATTYTWNGSGITGASIHHVTVTVTPTVTTTYTLTGTSSGCPSTPTILTITVTPTPVFSLTVTTPTVNGCAAPLAQAPNNICQGGVAYITASNNTLSYSWSTGATTPFITVTPTVTTTYTVTGDDGTCTTTHTITIVVNPCNCTGGGTALTSTLSGNITGNHVLNVNTTVSGTANISSAHVLISAGKTITVPNGATLNITSSHLNACNNMWQGIIVNPGGRVVVGNGSMIEDAEVAIDNGGSSSSPQFGTPPVILVNSAIFNCNRTAIRDAYYQDGTATNYSPSKFSINNAVITCRCGLNPSGGTAPLTAYVTATGTASTGNPSIDDYYSAANFTGGTLKMPNPVNTHAQEGIHFEYSGKLHNTTAGSPQPYSFNIGGSNLVLFDNLVYGINATQTTFSVTNSAFQFPQQNTTGFPFYIPISGGYGISAIAPKTDWYNGIYVNNSRFIRMVRGIHNIGYYDIDINNNTMFSKQVIQPAGGGLSITPPSGDYGMYISSGHFFKANMSNNIIANINNCIDFVMTPQGGTGNASNVTVNSNNMFNQFTTTSYTNTYIGNGIVVDNSPGSAVAGTKISVQGNTMINALRGILVRNQHLQEVRDENNRVFMLYEPTALTTESSQYGIAHDHVFFTSTNGYGNDIFNNNVTGFTTNYSNPIAFEPKKAIWSRYNNSHYVTCNNISNAGRGFEFEGTHTNIFWELNQMTSCGEGYALTNNGVIGSQFSSPSNASDNQWFGFLGTGANPNFETYTDASSNPTNSTLYLRNAATPYAPIYNNTAFSGTNYGYGGFGLSVIGTPSSYVCSTVPPMIVVKPNAGAAVERTIQNNSVSSTNYQRSFMEKIVQDSLYYPSYSAQNGFINKFMIYRMIKADSSLIDSSVILHNFYSASQSTCRASFCRIEDSLVTQNYSYAAGLVNALSPSCTIEQNYKRFYQIYINGMQGVCTSADTADLETLASLCPMLNGTVVFQARAFHNSMYSAFKHYEDNCPVNNISSRLSNSIQQKTETKLMLNFFPNPTTGIINVAGSDGANHSYKAEVYDLNSRLILKQDLILENGLGRFKLDAQNGVYMLYLYGEENKGAGVYRIMINK